MTCSAARALIRFTVLAACVTAASMGYLSWANDSVPKTEIVLLIHDSISKTDPRVDLWRDAALEKGLPIRLMHDSEYLRPWVHRSSYAGVILPDQVHRMVSDMLLYELREYVEQGGKLMLVYDAGTKTQNNFYAAGKSVFSSLAGIDYALYDRLREGTIVWGPVAGSRAGLDALGVPPGKYVTTGKYRKAHPLFAAVRNRRDPLRVLSGYQQPNVTYPGFVTGDVYRGSPLLISPTVGLVAGYRALKKGGVLFVNLPLGYLKGRTDGLLLHGFLHYFGVGLLSLPTLAQVPDGVGGLVMNWHVDSNAALKPIADMEALGIYAQGPYSIHITAGPDARRIGDGLGTDVPDNQKIRKWIQDTVRRGDRIGDHGGWIHDYFAKGAAENNRQQYEKYLFLNTRALEQASGTSIQEYSAPAGNQPEWVTAWLEEHGFLAYYFTGNAGMGPTRSYRDGRLAHKRIWSFPVLTFASMASFEEMRANGVGEREAGRWLTAVTNFSADRRVCRLVYFHPPGAMFYPGAMRAWLAHSAGLIRAKRFHWYVMSDLARFLNDRERVAWTVASRRGDRIFTASHPQNLAHQTWILPKPAYGRPRVVLGNADVSEDRHQWLVTARGGRELQFESQRPIEP